VEDFRVRIRLLGPLGTPWQSDTLFGHICWQIARGATELEIDEFLEPFRRGEPLFILSDGFPGELLPRPLLPVDTSAARSPEAYAAARRRTKALYVGQDDFQALRRGDVTGWEPAEDPWVAFETPHAAIDRGTSSTAGGEAGEGGRFFLTPLQALGDVEAHGDRISVYLRARAPWGERVPELLGRMAPLGFGRDRSVGAGAFEVLSVEPWEGFSCVPGANGFVSLSSLCPARDDPTVGRWRVRLKHGKLGEGAGEGNPFKRPLVQFEPGAVFLCRPDGREEAPRPFYGRVVPSIAPGMPGAVQGCHSISVPCRIPPELVEAFL